jgi:hypothetical protein
MRDALAAALRTWQGSRNEEADAIIAALAERHVYLNRLGRTDAPPPSQRTDRD